MNFMNLLLTLKVRVDSGANYEYNKIGTPHPCIGWARIAAILLFREIIQQMRLPYEFTWLPAPDKGIEFL